MTAEARRPSPEMLARPHLYDDERIVWTGPQRVPRISLLRVVLAAPGALFVVLAVRLAYGMAELGRAAAGGSSEWGLEIFVALLFLAGAAWLWGMLFKPIEAYRGVRRVYAVLTDQRLLFVEVLAGGKSRVRHPYRCAILRPGDVRSVSVHVHGPGRGVIRARSEGAPHRRDVRVEVRGRAPAQGVEDVAALLCHHLAVPDEGPRRRRHVRVTAS